MNSVIDPLVRCRLNVPIGPADTNYFCYLPPVESDQQRAEIRCYYLRRVITNSKSLEVSFLV